MRDNRDFANPRELGRQQPPPLPRDNGRQNEDVIPTIADRNVPVQGQRGPQYDNFTRPMNNNFARPGRQFDKPQFGRQFDKPQFGLQQSGLAKSVSDTQKSYVGFRGPKVQQPSVVPNTPKPPTTKLPNLDDINRENINKRRYVDYQTHYATTESKRSLKDKYKRSKYRSKKSTGLLDDYQQSSGNSILDSYRRLGQSLSRR